jgi:hypothetical protein
MMISALLSVLLLPLFSVSPSSLSLSLRDTRREGKRGPVSERLGVREGERDTYGIIGYIVYRAIYRK